MRFQFQKLLNSFCESLNESFDQKQLKSEVPNFTVLDRLQYQDFNNICKQEWFNQFSEQAFASFIKILRQPVSNFQFDIDPQYVALKNKIAAKIKKDSLLFKKKTVSSDFCCQTDPVRQDIAVVNQQQNFEQESLILNHISSVLQNLDDSVAVFQKHSNNSGTISLIWSNQSFAYLLQTDRYPKEQVFNLKLFQKLNLNDQWSKAISFNDFLCVKKSVGGSYQHFLIKFAEELYIKELSHVKFLVTVKDLVIEDKKLIQIVLSNCSEVINLEFRKMQKKFSNLLINAIAHEKMTPLNQIIGISFNMVERNQRNLNSIQLNLNNNSSQLQYSQVSRNAKNNKQPRSRSSSSNSSIKLISEEYIDEAKNQIQGDVSEVKSIWSSANQMYQMSQSQLICYQLQINSYNFKLKSIPSFSQFLKSLLQPFQIQLESKQIAFAFNQKIDGTSFPDFLEFDLQIQEVVLDYEIYSCIMYHLISNSIKHSPNKTTIRLNLEYTTEVCRTQKFSGTLTTIVQDQSTGFVDSKILDKNLKMFSIQRVNDLSNQQQGVGIGLSTVKILTKALGGQVSIKSQVNDSLIKNGTEVCFNLKTLSNYDSSFYKKNFNDVKEAQEDFSQDNNIMQKFCVIDRFLNKDQHKPQEAKKNIVIIADESSASMSSQDLDESFFTPQLYESHIKQISKKLQKEKSRVNFQRNQLEENQLKIKCCRKNLDSYILQKNLSIHSLIQESTTQKQINFKQKKRYFSDYQLQSIQEKSKFCTKICDIQVLLIDDSVFNSSCLEAIIFECFGLKSICFESGYDAISCYQHRLSLRCCKKKFELIITDIQMPVIDGFEVANLIQQIQKFCNKKKKCPVLAATAFVSDDVYSKAAKVGVQHVLHKPVKREDLFKCLKKVLND